MRLLPLCLLLIGLNAHAQAWISVGASADGEMFVDVASIKQQGQYRKAWIRFAYAVPQATAYGAQSSLKSLEYFECKSGASAIKQELWYEDQGGYGRVLTSYTYPDTQMTFEDPVPGSLGKKILDRVCGWRVGLESRRNRAFGAVLRALSVVSSTPELQSIANPHILQKPVHHNHQGSNVS